MSIQHRGSASLAPKLSVRDLEEIRSIMKECMEELAEEINARYPEPLPEYLTTNEVSLLTKYKKSALEALRAKGLGPPFYKQGFSVRYRRDEVCAWIEAERFAGGEPSKPGPRASAKLLLKSSRSA